MKKILTFIILFISCQSFGQTYPSNCTIPALLKSTYQWDIKNLALRRIIEFHNPDTALVTIPQPWQDTIAEGMAAILNAIAMPQRDSIFNLYCVHDKAPNVVFIDKEIMVAVDTIYSWTHQWQNLQTMTGNPQMDYLLTKYDLHIVHFYNWSFAKVALLGTDSLWNIYALMDSIEMVPGVVYCDPNSVIGTAGRINYSVSGNDRFYDFAFQWSDCFDGCDNSATWHFRVLPDCSVEFLGRTDLGYFGIQPLPLPENCNLFTGIPQSPDQNSDFLLYPNPSDGLVTLKIDGDPVNNSLIQVYSVTGELVHSSSFTGSNPTLDLSMLIPGFYTIHLEDGQKTLSHKLVLCK